LNEFPFPPRLARELAPVQDWMGKIKDALDERFKFGEGSPEGVVTADIGCQYVNTDGGASTTIYIKTSGNDTNTGWTAK